MQKEGIKLSGIVAMTGERVIGKDNDLPWRLPEDLKMFKRTTSGYQFVSEFETYEVLETYEEFEVRRYVRK